MPSTKNDITPKVSVVIPTFNRAQLLKDCLESVANQTVNFFEVIVGDDGSNDNTREIIKAFRSRFHLKYFRIENFGGPARVRNIAIRKARGDYIAFLDSDDSWLPKKLEVSCEFLDAGADLVYHDLHLMGTEAKKFPRKTRVRTRSLRSPIERDLLVYGNCITNSSVVVRRHLLLSIGLITEDQELIAAEDFDTWLRIAGLTDKFVRINQCLGYYQMGSNNLSSFERSVSLTNRLLVAHRCLILKYGYTIPPWAIFSLAKSHLKSSRYEEASRVLKYGIAQVKAIPLERKLIMIIFIIYANFKKILFRVFQ